MKVYILRETDGIDDWILGVYAARGRAENEKYELEKIPKQDIAIYSLTEHEVIDSD